MGAMPNEPSMEEILSSIKRIIAEEDGAALPPRGPRRVAQAAPSEAVEDDIADDHVLELTQALHGEDQTGTEAASAQKEPVMTAPAKPESKPESKAARTETKATPRQRAAAPAAQGETPATVISDASAQAARDSLVNLSMLLVRSDDGQSNTLEGLVRELLRPVLKEWLDAHLPELVESMVKREIDRITGRV